MKTLAAAHPQVAGRLRQGQPATLVGRELTVTFPPLFAEHAAFLEDDEARAAVEALFERELGERLLLRCALRETGHRERTTEETPASALGDLEDFSADEKVALLQRLLGAKIRSVLPDPMEIEYPLAKSPNFREGEPPWTSSKS